MAQSLFEDCTSSTTPREADCRSLLSGNPAGGVWRVPPGGGTPQLLTTDVILPGGIAVDAQGSLYVSTCAPCANVGTVVKIVP